MVELIWLTQLQLASQSSRYALIYFTNLFSAILEICVS
jgi:hypothetical protein